jgi:hypothetical protein
MIDLILWADLQHFFDEGLVLRATLAAGSLRDCKDELLAALALAHSSFGTPPVDDAKLHLVDLIVRFYALNNLRDHRSSFLPP